MSTQNSNKIEYAFNNGKTRCDIIRKNKVYMVDIPKMEIIQKNTEKKEMIHRCIPMEQNIDLWRIQNTNLNADVSCILNISFYYWITTRDCKYKYQAIAIYDIMVDFESMSTSDNKKIQCPDGYLQECIEEMCSDVVESNAESNNENVDTDHMCPITYSKFIDPVICADGHTYERSAICKWLAFHNTSPLTNEILSTTILFPNMIIKKQL